MMRMRRVVQLVSCLLVLGSPCVAMAELALSYVEERTSALNELTRALTPASPDSERVLAFRNVEASARTFFASYPDQLAVTLARLALPFASVHQVNESQRLFREAVILVRGPGAHSPDAAVEIEMTYGGFLIDSGDPVGARECFKRAADYVVHQWNPASAFRQRELYTLAQVLGRLGAPNDEHTLQALASSAQLEKWSVPSGSYTEERRTFWRGTLQVFATTTVNLKSDSDWQEQRLRLDQSIEADFGHDVYLYAEEHLALARAFMNASRGLEADEERKTARDALRKAGLSFPDLEIALDELDATFFILEGQFERAYTACEDALSREAGLFGKDSPFRPALYLYVAELLYRGEYIDRTIELAKRLIGEFEGDQRFAALIAPAEQLLALSYVSQRQFDLADQKLRCALSIEQALPPPSSFNFPGGPAMTAEQRDRFERDLMVGRYAKALKVASIHRSIAENDLNTEDRDQWRKDSSLALETISASFGTDSPQYLDMLEGLIAPARVALGAGEVHPLAERFKSLLTAQSIHDDRLRRANDYLAPDHALPLTTEESDEILRRAANGQGDAQALLNVEQAYVRIERGELSEAVGLLDKAIQWRDSKGLLWLATEVVSSGAAASRSAVLTQLMIVLLRASDAISGTDGQHQRLIEEAFRTAQMIQVQRIDSGLKFMFLRHSRTNQDGEFNDLVRAYEEGNAKLRHQERELTAVLALDPAKAMGQAQKLEHARLAQQHLADRITASDASSQPAVPAFATLSSVQNTISNDEALVLFTFAPTGDGAWSHGAIFIVTKSDITAVPLCTGGDICTRPGRLFGATNSYLTFVTPDGGRGQRPVFGSYVGRAQGPEIGLELYRTLWSQVDARLSQAATPITKVTLVPDLYVAQFPFSALVTEMRAGTPHWLAEKYAIAYLPAVLSLQSTPVAAGSHRGRLVAIADPINRHYQPLSNLTNEACDLVRLFTSTGAPPSGDISKEQTLADCRRQVEFSSGNIRVLLQKEATRANVLHLSETQQLQSLEVLAFATHGDSVGTTLHEPGVVLSTTDDDPAGFLPIGDVAQMHVDADIVVLSACETARSPGMGIRLRQIPTVAASFIESGAKSVLATFTVVSSDASRQIMTQTLGYARGSPNQSVAQSLQRAIVAEIARGQPPDYWAPFMYIGRQ